MTSVDCIYVAASARDARLVRICVASIRYFYPDVPIRILPGGTLQRGLARELQHHWGVEMATVPQGDYGWGFVKLEPLFGPPGETFLVMDADTVFTGRVLDIRAQTDALFLVDDEQLPDTDLKRLYYDWDKVREVDRAVQPARRAFNSGQWFGTAGVIMREEFEPWIEFAFPRRVRHPQLFMGGDQGVLNLVMLKKEAVDGLRIDRRPIMQWPGHSMEGLNVEAVAAGTAPPRIIHWAGMKKTFIRNTTGAEVLTFFEKAYYRRLRAGRLRRLAASGYHAWLQWRHSIGGRMFLARRKLSTNLFAKRVGPVR